MTINRENRLAPYKRIYERQAVIMTTREFLVLTNFLPNFRAVFMRDTLSNTPHQNESGIVNFNTSKQMGSHWICFFKENSERIYFDSYGQVCLSEIQVYLKKSSEKNKQVIQRNTDIIQKPNTNIC